MRKRALGIHKGIQHIGAMLGRARNNKIRNLLLRYNAYITLDILDSRDRPGICNPVNIRADITIDTVSFIYHEILGA